MKIEIDGYSPKHVSYSALDGYARCGKQYQLSRVLQLEEKPGLAALAGNAIHRATQLIDEATFAGVPVSFRAEEFHGVSVDMLTKDSQ